MKIKTYTINHWCQIFGIEIIDNDGFRGLDLDKNEIALDRFIEGIASCTINPTNRDKYLVLNALF